MKEINGKMFKQMVLSGAIVLHNNHPEVDALNVFPVPDGDTGTNMSLTFNSGAEQVEKLADDTSIGDIAKTLSKGLLMGARGNSGVILSQIFRGVAKSLKGKETANVAELSDAFSSGAKVAYKAVMRPVEGTILTVIRESADAAAKYVQPDMEIEDWFSYFVKSAEKSLDNTPELLPVLKEVGVVDSGGAGLLLVLTGFMAALAGEVIEKVDNVGAASDVEIVQEEEKPYGYRVQFTLKIDDRKMNAFNLDGFINELKNLPGKNVDVAQKDNKVIGNVDTLKPGNALNTGLRFGEFTKVTVVNTEVSEEEKEEDIPMAPAKEMALISVAAGDGIKDMFLELNCDHVVSGGQTMNPATEDIVKAIKGVNAKHVIILPNNSNIVMTAQQAATVLEGEVDVVVLPTKTIPQGLSAAIMYNPEATLDENVDEMKEAIANVKTGQVTFAIKDTSIDGLEIKANNYMALCEKKIVACVPDKLEALKSVLSNLVDEDSEIVTLICGEDVTEEEQEAAASFIEENHEDVECEVHVGKQPVYSFIVGVE